MDEQEGRRTNVCMLGIVGKLVAINEVNRLYLYDGALFLSYESAVGAPKK